MNESDTNLFEKTFEIKEISIVGSCHECGRSGIKLWRKTHTYPAEGDILCAKHLKMYDSWPYSVLPDHRIKNGVSYVPAVPMTGCDDSDGNVLYWGYSSVPKDAADTWYSLDE